MMNDGIWKSAYGEWGGTIMKIIIFNCNCCGCKQTYSDGLKSLNSNIEILICIKCGNRLERKVDTKL